MPHITEGLLHAHLDGALGPDEQLQWAEAEAHLEVCDDCRRLLGEAAELRDAARDLLAGAGPAAPAGRPAFDELVERARDRRAAPASGGKPAAREGGAWWRTPATLAWAASLVMAAGAGWIGRQLAVEDGLDVPAVAEQDAPLGRTGVQEGAVLDDDREDATPGEARAARRDAAAAPAAPETEARFRAEAEVESEPGQGARPAAEQLQQKADPRADEELGADADAEPGADANRMQEIAPLAVGAGAASGARCFASPAAGDGREGAAGNLETLRLAPDGTATMRLDGRPMVGFWERGGADSVRLRVTDGDRWRELALVEAASGMRGDVELETVVCP